MSEREEPSTAIEEATAAAVEGLPEEIRELVAGWIRRAREAGAAEVEAELLADARECRRRFRAAAAEVTRIISEPVEGGAGKPSGVEGS